MYTATWSAMQYREAALKHFDACNCMLKKLETKKAQKSAILSEVYYLGGYVIECALKYFVLINQGDKVKMYTKSELYDLSIWHHDLTKLLTTARDTSEEINFSENRWCAFTKKWDVQQRYGSRISSNDYMSITDSFWKDVLFIYEIIQNN